MCNFKTTDTLRICKCTYWTNSPEVYGYHSLVFWYVITMIILALTEFVSVLYFAIKAGSKCLHLREIISLYDFFSKLYYDVSLTVTAEIIDALNFIYCNVWCDCFLSDRIENTLLWGKKSFKKEYCCAPFARLVTA